MIRKQDVGLLPLTDGMFGVAAPTFVGQAPNDVNTPLPLPEPVSVNNLNALTLVEISNLARQAGTNFGIEHGDRIATRRLKILRYFKGYGR